MTFSLRGYLVKADNSANLYKIVHKAVEIISERLYDLQDNSRNSILNSEDAFKTAEDVRTVLMATLQVSIHMENYCLFNGF